jgi:hypothetical protein
LSLNYARMPGSGDLLGDSSHPNSPDYEEPAFGRDDAIESVTDQLISDEEVAELVQDVANARHLLNWVAHELVVPAHLRPLFQSLDRQARSLDGRIDAQLAALNGEAA